MRILFWLLGIVILFFGYLLIALFNELKILLFNKTLTTEEKNEIISDVKWLYVVPIIFFISWFLLSSNRFIYLLVFFLLTMVVGFLLKGKKDIKQSAQKNRGKAATDLLIEGGEGGDDIYEEIFKP